MTVQEMLQARALPPLCAREDMLDVLQKEIYGYLPPKPDAITFTLSENLRRHFMAGKATYRQLTVDCTIGEKHFAFPCSVVLPTAPGKHPFFVMLNFRDCVPDMYLPTEELLDHGFAVLSFSYLDITSDDNDFTNGLAGVCYPDGTRGPSDAGKIALWAWAAMRVMDYAETRGDVLDLSNATVCGHSRLGKTALLCGAMDPRFSFVYSNNSGCSGASLSRGNTGESIARICKNFPFWFCTNYYAYADRAEALPCDQHYLVASIAPRKVLIGSAAEDGWAAPVSEFLCAVAANPAFAADAQMQHTDTLPSANDAFLNGDIGYHIRPGEHFFSRLDWQRLITFIRLHS